MKLRMPVILIAALCGLCGTELAQAPPRAPKPPGRGQYRIAGTVVQHKTGQPLRRAVVTIRPVEQRNESASVLTGSDGLFEFLNIPKGKYSLEAESAGVMQLFHENEQFSTAIATGPGLDSEHIVFPFTKTAGMRVSAADEEGDPVQASIYLFEKVMSDGWPQIRMAQQAGMNSTRATRLSSLHPGTYLLGISGRPWYADAIVADSNQQEDSGQPRLDAAFPVTYYPDVTAPEAAAPITLEEGGSADIKVSMHSAPSARLSGPPENVPTISAAGPGGFLMSVQGGSYGDDKHFTLAGFTAGRYIVSVTRNSTVGGRPGPQTIPVNSPPTVSSSGFVDLAGSMNLNALTFSRTVISGSITVDGGGAGGQVTMVGLQNVESGAVIWTNATPEGKFTMPAEQVIAQGRYKILVGNTRNLYMQSMTAKGAAIDEGLIEVAQGASISLSIKTAHGATKIDGTATRGGKPFGGAMILLVPRDSKFPHSIRRDQSDSDGTFTLPDVAPGHYTLVAIDDGADLAYQNRGVLQAYLAEGKDIQVSLPRTSAEPVQVEIAARK